MIRKNKKKGWRVKALAMSIFPLAFASFCARSQEIEISSGKCVFAYVSSSLVSLVENSPQVIVSRSVIDGESWTSSSGDAEMDLPLCDAKRGYCIKLGGVAFYLPAENSSKREWHHAGVDYVKGSSFSDASRGVASVTPVFAYQEKSANSGTLEFDAVFLIDNDENLLGYSYWISGAKLGSESVKLLTSYWLEGKYAPMRCFRGRKALVKPAG